MDECLKERYDLARGRLGEIAGEDTVAKPFRAFFAKTASFMIRAMEIAETDQKGCSLEELKDMNRELYEDILPENYGKSYGNPTYAGEVLGEYGPEFCFLYGEIRGIIVYAFEKRLWDVTVIIELFLEVYGAFNQEEIPSVKEMKGILKSYVEDYCQDMMRDRTRECLDASLDFAANIILKEDLSDLRYLYRFGEYISENEFRTAEYLNSLSEDEVYAMAKTYTEGYRIGFVNARKPLSKKKTVNVRYQLGFERMVRAAILQFEEMGLASVIYRHAAHVVNRSERGRIGYTGAEANPQYDYDHRQDAALFLDQDFVQKKLRASQNAYEEYADLAAVHGGPAVIETFGEEPFSPVMNEHAFSYNQNQKQLKQELDNEMSQITNRYIKGDERSFTIIAYPLPAIGEQYEEIFRETIRINTLDYKKYQKIQQTIIDTLDTCEWVEVKGGEKNETDLRIHLHTLTDPASQTNFENCVADVNIPVGEVFTSPVLDGTDGTLHVSEVYLNGLQYKDLKLIFKGGKVVDYTCGNFDSEKENRKYVEDNILFHHENIPMGEFAIGTNTTAYVVGEKYGIAEKLPILIAEKTGPHFAVGDTCYSWEEDNPVFNPDGKEIIARDNEVSILRKEDLNRAYLGCHTDVTIPYKELGSIRTVHENGEKTSIIEDGRFVLPGTEELNVPLEELADC
ncbi:MAG: aminopeptidase [Eubacteriales bacterium]|nr:aminopeptidase [Eubacteriales bacterium]